jgi:hypothetical protein
MKKRLPYARKNCTFITIPFSKDDKFKRKRGKIKAIKVDMLTSKMEFTFFDLSHFKHQQPCMPGTQPNHSCLDFPAS